MAIYWKPTLVKVGVILGGVILGIIGGIALAALLNWLYERKQSSV